MRMRCVLWAGMVTAYLGAASAAGEWPQWGRTGARNMASDEKNLPDLRPPTEGGTTNLSADSPYVKWKVPVGTTTWGNPTIAGGKVFVGTSGPARKGGMVKCIDAAGGKILWELFAPPRKFEVPERPADYAKYSQWDLLVTTHAQTHGWGICSSVTVEGDRAYVLTQRGELVCLDVNGMANGNDGPFKNEAGYQESDEASANSADILWIYDLWTELKTRPADTFSNAALIHGDLLYISTCNGIDRWPLWYGKPASPPNPNAPNLIAVDKRTGRLVATDEMPIGKALLHGQWSPPSIGEVNGKTLIFYGGGDGVCYAVEALKKVPAAVVKLKTVWSYDCNPPEYKGVNAENYTLGDVDVLKQAPGDLKAVAAEYARHLDKNGRLLAMSEIVGSPVFHNGRVYVAIGRDPRHGPGRGALHCIDASKTGDISSTGRIWCYDTIDRSLSTPSVADGLVYIPDLTGRLHCLDADTGKVCWTHDTRTETWGSTLVADAKVYLITRKSFHVLAAGRVKNEYSTIRLGADCTPVAADGVVYAVLRGTLYALHNPPAAPKTSRTPAPTTQTTPENPASNPAQRDWPAWRGPLGDGFSGDIPDRLPPKKLLWRRDMAGESHAPLSVAHGCLIAPDHDKKRDFWRCFDAADGRPRWTHEYANAQKMEYGAAPRAAPLIVDDKAYCMSACGELFCLRLADGRVVWRKRIGREHAEKPPEWGYCVSPRIADGKLIVSPGPDGRPLAALDPRTGQLLWSGAGKGMNYAGLLIGVFGGVSQVIGYDANTAGGWELATGRRLWTLKVGAERGYIVPTPVAVGPRVLLTSDAQDARLFGFASGGAIEPRPHAVNDDLAPEISTATLWGDAILGASNGLVLLDAAPAAPEGLLRTLWLHEKEESTRGLCHAIASRRRALLMCEDGRVLLLAADRSACRVLDRQSLCEKTYVHPALANGRLYVRDAAALYCYDLRPVVPAGTAPAGR